MRGRRKSRSGDSGRDLWRLYRKNRSALPSDGSPSDPLEMAAYLDDTLEVSEREYLEARYAEDPEIAELLVAARSALDRREDAPDDVRARAVALVPDPIEAEGPRFMEWLRAFLGVPGRPFVAASAFGLYALLCLASFGLGAGIGLPGDPATAREESRVEFELFGNDDDWL